MRYEINTSFGVYENVFRSANAGDYYSQVLSSMAQNVTPASSNGIAYSYEMHNGTDSQDLIIYGVGEGYFVSLTASGRHLNVATAADILAADINITG